MTYTVTIYQVKGTLGRWAYRLQSGIRSEDTWASKAAVVRVARRNGFAIVFA